jgi:hypothetical protein
VEETHLSGAIRSDAAGLEGGRAGVAILAVARVEVEVEVADTLPGFGIVDPELKEVVVLKRLAHTQIRFI